MTASDDAGARELEAARAGTLAGIRERLSEYSRPKQVSEYREQEVYLSDADLKFAEHAPADIRFLLDVLAATERELARARAALAMLAEWVGGDMHYASPDVEQAVKEALARVDG